VVEAAVREAIAAIEEDAADVITFGCSALFWLQPILQKRLDEMGWDVPVLEGYGCAIKLAKAIVDLGVSASGLLYPSAHPKKIRRRKLFDPRARRGRGQGEGGSSQAPRPLAYTFDRRIPSPSGRGPG